MGRRKLAHQNCHWCDRELLPFGDLSGRGATRDHVIPKSMGGTETVVACRACNEIKGAMSPTEGDGFMGNNPGWWLLYGTRHKITEGGKLIEGMRKGRGAPKAKAVCDECSETVEIPCAYEGSTPNEGQIISRLTQQGWSNVKGKLRCPECEEKRKAVPMKSFKELEPPMEIREPTRKERREIMLMLAEVYDTDQERYRQGDTDDSVAEVLGVMPGWVAEIREDTFGPDGGNEDIEALESELATFRAEATKLLDDATKANQAVVKTLEQARDFAARLDKIKKAVGPRNLKKAGVS